MLLLVKMAVSLIFSRNSINCHEMGCSLVASRLCWPQSERKKTCSWDRTKTQFSSSQSAVDWCRLLSVVPWLTLTCTARDQLCTHTVTNPESLAEGGRGTGRWCVRWCVMMWDDVWALRKVLGKQADGVWDGYKRGCETGKSWSVGRIRRMQTHSYSVVWGSTQGETRVVPGGVNVMHYV